MSESSNFDSDAEENAMINSLEATNLILCFSSSSCFITWKIIRFNASKRGQLSLKMIFGPFSTGNKVIKFLGQPSCWQPQTIQTRKHYIQCFCNNIIFINITFVFSLPCCRSIVLKEVFLIVADNMSERALIKKSYQTLYVHPTNVQV